MSILDSLNAYTSLRALVSGLVLDEVEREKYLNRLDAMVPKMVDGLEAEIRWTIERSLPKPTATPVTQVAQEPLKADYSYDDFAELAERYGRNPADFVRVWFQDLPGGYELSTATERVDVYAKARAWCVAQQARAATTAARPQVLNGGQGRGQTRQGGGRRQPNPIGPCPTCGPQGTEMIKTRYGQRWRCDAHDYWGDVG